MIISSPLDYRAIAQKKLPAFLFHFLEGGAYNEYTLKRNILDLSRIALRQRVLCDTSDLDMSIDLFGQKLAFPAIIAPIGLMGMFARRGEKQVAKAAYSRNIPHILSTMSICPLEEVQKVSPTPLWFQLYVLKDKGFMTNVLDRAKAAGMTTLVFTVDMPTPGARYRDAHSGLSGPHAALRRYLQCLLSPSWSWDVGLKGRPHDLGNVSAYMGKSVGLEDYMGWLGKNFDPSLSWKDLEWIRKTWTGPLIIKGILTPEDAQDAVSLGADGISVSNHGGRQLDGVYSSCRALPSIADAVKGQIKILADSGVRSGLDIARMIALGADAVLLGRPIIYALSAAGQQGVENVLDIIKKELKVAMTLIGTPNIASITRENIQI